MILVYTGNGKGKTSASVGQAVRALGQGLRVAFLQYMKRAGAGGEQKVLGDLLGEGFHAGGLGFLRDARDFPRHREAALKVTAMARERIPSLDMLILDEALYALDAGLLAEDELRALIALCEERGAHLVLSGRNAPPWLREAAHLVSEITEVKHPYTQNIQAQRGVEF
ncbi:MAG: cob(I)yrinic acid a,c-diamide adenosyltransferase [Deltaproteobacteria bacterium]|jgi:cob(I)alamin adenosyltransferase|nr:cob(I)yrinic acid a,c-diamide adenosyltransferase [Deltaproteobacteria bacterium]